MQMNHAVSWMFLFFVLAAVHVVAVAGESVSVGESATAVAVARVNGRPIYAAEVRREMARALGDCKIEPSAEPIVQAQTLSQLIDRRLVLGYLLRSKTYLSEQDVTLAVERFEKQLAGQGVTLKDFLAKTGIDLATLKQELAWKVGWKRYLDRRLTDENLKKFFDAHRRDFDGTQIRAEQILLRVKSADDQDAVAEAVSRAAAIRREIESGHTTFAEAAKKHSQSPSAEQGGELGFITRRDSMPEAFSRAAFALKEGEISEPVVSPFGVHLIQCLEVKPGKKTWQEVRGQLEPAAARFVFDWIASRERPAAKIEFTGAMPHFKPGTNELQK